MPIRLPEPEATKESSHEHHRNPHRARRRNRFCTRSGTAPTPGVVIGVISRGGGQSPVTHEVVYVVAAALLLAALLCALVGAAVASLARSGLRG